MSEAKVREYHQSEVGMFLKCGKQWEFRYERGMILPPKAALTVGGAVDTGVTKNLIHKVETSADLPLNDVLDIYSADFDKRSVTTDWDGDDAGKQKDVGAQLLKAHHEKFAPSIAPETVQEKFLIETDVGYNIGGTIDLTTVDGWVRDTKTAARAYDEDAVQNSLQAAIYDFAYENLRGRRAKGFAFDVLIKPTKTIPARTQQVTGIVSQVAREHAFNAVQNMHRAIEAGVAMPAAEGSWWCSKDWCGYWSMCKGKRK